MTQDNKSHWNEPHPSEGQVAAAWAAQSFNRESLLAQDGSPLQIVFAGRRSGLRGPDFTDAIISIAGQLNHGHVEIHVRASDFIRHGHHLDKHYDSVILHVVFLDDVPTSAVLLHNGKSPAV